MALLFGSPFLRCTSTTAPPLAEAPPLRPQEASTAPYQPLQPTGAQPSVTGLTTVGPRPRREVGAARRAVTPRPSALPIPDGKPVADGRVAIAF